MCIYVCVRECTCVRATVSQQLNQALREMETIFSASYVHPCAHVYTYYESRRSPGRKMFMTSPEDTLTHSHM